MRAVLVDGVLWVPRRADGPGIVGDYMAPLEPSDPEFDEWMLEAVPGVGSWPLEDGLTAAAWDESKHPRDPAGEPTGGRFVPKEDRYKIGRYTQGYHSRLPVWKILDRQAPISAGDDRYVGDWYRTKREAEEALAGILAEEASGGEFGSLRGEFDSYRADWEARQAEWEGESDFSSFEQFYADEQGMAEIPQDWILGWTYEQETIDATDEAIRGASGSRDRIAVYRGEPGVPEPGVRDRPTSTSLSKAQAMNYADRTGRGDETGLMRVVIPEGTKLGWAGGEDEVVLPSGTDYQLQPDGTYLAVVPDEYKAEWALTSSGEIEGEGPLVELYQRVLERSARQAASRYRRAGVVAAGEPLERVLNEAELSEASRKALKKAREEIAREAALAQAVQFGISFAVRSPYLAGLVEEHAGRQAERLVEGSRRVVARVIAQSLEEGWSVPQTADAIKERLLEVAPWQATMLARTDLISLKNGGSYAAALKLRESRPVYKQWVSARDERVRPTHVAANGQVVELRSPFQVGEAQLLYPGDPSGPDEEVINCRCTQIYSDDPRSVVDRVVASAWAEVAAAWNEEDHPRAPGGTPTGGQFVSAESPAVYSFKQREAVAAYQGAWYSAINHMLRDPDDFEVRLSKKESAGAWAWVPNPDLGGPARDVSLGDVRAEAERMVPQLDSVMVPSAEEMEVYRYNYGPSVDPTLSMEGGMLEDLYGNLEELEGRVVTDAGFQSTTVDRDWVARRLGAESDGIMHVIRVPKGTPSAYLPRVTPGSAFDGEKEMLLGRGLRLKAVKVSKDGNKYEIRWEIVP